MRKNPAVIGVDSSTQSTKAAFTDAATGWLLAVGRAPHQVSGEGGARESDPEVWWHALREAVASCPLRLVGGGARGRHWVETVRRLSGRPLLIPESGELVALGAAALAAASATGEDPVALAAGWQGGNSAALPPVQRDMDMGAGLRCPRPGGWDAAGLTRLTRRHGDATREKKRSPHQGCRGSRGVGGVAQDQTQVLDVEECLVEKFGDMVVVQAVDDGAALAFAGDQAEVAQQAQLVGAGGLLIVVFATSGALEALVTARTQDSVRGLLDPAPATATVLSGDGGEESVPTTDLSVGDIVLVRPGERVGADGRVLEGVSEVDQATITGEPLPARRTATGRAAST
jgi:hypothetical protein